MTTLLGGIGGAIGGLLGGVNDPAPKINFTPPGFSAGGLSATFNGNTYGVSADPSRLAAVGGVAGTFGQQANALSKIAGQWTPGFSNLRTSLMNSLQNNRTQALGNLRENLSSRRVLGSSFAQDTLARADQEYQQQIEKAQADTFLQELQATQQTNQMQYEAARGQYQTVINEMNLEAGLAADLTAKAGPLLQNVATTQTQLDAAFQANKMQFWAGTGASIGAGIGNIAGSALGSFGLPGGSPGGGSIGKGGL